jgi:hypothetical protein
MYVAYVSKRIPAYRMYVFEVSKREPAYRMLTGSLMGSPGRSWLEKHSFLLDFQLKNVLWESPEISWQMLVRKVPFSIRFSIKKRALGVSWDILAGQDVIGDSQRALF